MRVHELAAQGLRETLDRVLGGAVRALQGNAPVRERRADLDDHAAVARTHAPQGAERAVDDAQVCDLGHAPELLGRDLSDRSENAHHRVVDPHVYAPELILERLRSALDGVRVGHVGGQGHCLAAEATNLLGRGRESVGASGQQPHGGTFERECTCGRTPDARARARQRDDELRTARGWRPLALPLHHRRLSGGGRAGLRPALRRQRRLRRALGPAGGRG